LESELAACWEGFSLAIKWSALPIVIQSDCSEVVKLITETGEDRSAHMMMVQEIKKLLQENREFLVKHIKREQNIVS
jgi:ribonuclease HI